MKTLSIRQPWAWLIVNGHKDVENRNWPTRFRGRIYVHAGKGMTRAEYEDCELHVETVNEETGSNIQLPKYEELLRGGLVGAVDITGCVDRSESPWFVGDYGFTLANAVALPFIPYKGELGFFEVHIAASEFRIEEGA